MDTQAKRMSSMLDELLLIPDGDISGADDRGWMLGFYVGPVPAESAAGIALTLLTRSFALTLPDIR
jgi:hypothetical protein